MLPRPLHEAAGAGLYRIGPLAMQMVAEVGAENNSTTILMIPSDFVNAARTLGDYLRDREPRPTPPTSG